MNIISIIEEMEANNRRMVKVKDKMYHLLKETIMNTYLISSKEHDLKKIYYGTEEKAQSLAAQMTKVFDAVFTAVKYEDAFKASSLSYK